MAYIRDRNTVDILPVSRKPPPNPLLGYDGGETAPPSTATSPSCATQNSLAHWVLLYDQRCLVTGAVSTQLRPYHLVNKIHINKSNPEEKLAQKKEVERILTRQQFGIEDFFLDSLPNCITLDVQWHSDLDTHGSFCITVPLDQIIAIVTKLVACNRDWERRVKVDPEALRNLEITKEPFVVEKCVLLVLRPDHFLPEDRPLLINTRRVLREPGGPPLSAPDSPSWTQYLPQRDHPYLVDPYGQEFTEFDFVSKRRQEQSLSIFSLLVNANSKLQAAKQRWDYPPHVINYIVNVEAAVRDIFFVPREIQKRALSEKSSESYYVL